MEKFDLRENERLIGKEYASPTSQSCWFSPRPTRASCL